jgi:signal transduction histidine kinase
MKKILLLPFFFAFQAGVFAQNYHYADSLKHLLATEQEEDTTTVIHYLRLASYYTWSFPDTAIMYFQKAYLLSNRLEFRRGVINALEGQAYPLSLVREDSAAVSVALRKVQLAEEAKDDRRLAGAWFTLGSVYIHLRDFEKGLLYHRKALGYTSSSDTDFINVTNQHIAGCFLGLNQPDSADMYAKKVLRYNNLHQIENGFDVYQMGSVFFQKGLLDSAHRYYREGLAMVTNQGILKDMANCNLGIANVFHERQVYDSAIYYARAAWEIAGMTGLANEKLEALDKLTSLFAATGNTDSAFVYQQHALHLKDNIYNADKVRQVQLLAFNEELKKQQETEEERMRSNRILIYGLLALLALTIIIAGIIYRNNKLRQKAYTLLKRQKEQIDRQKRAAEIETGLERVRSRTMAMHHTEELKEVIQVVFDQLKGLNIHIDYAGFILDFKEREDMHIWLADHQQGVPTEITIPYFDSPHWNSLLEAKAKQESFFANLLPFEVKNKFYQDLSEWIPTMTEEAQQAIFSKPALAISTVLLDNVGLYIEHYSETPFTPEENAVLMRFGKVFQQTYTRFLDLQKAEAQARAAQIESALEKVRSRSLAMQSPDELIEVAQLLREEMGALGVEELETSSIYIHDESSGKTQCWFTIKNADNSGKAITDQMTIDLHETWVGQQMYDFYKSAEKQISIRMQGVQRIEWIRYCEEKSDLFGTSNFYGDTIPERTYHLVKFSNGFMGAAAPGEISKESRELLKRATAVFSFAYTRFRDLQMAEASARASLRQASLDRVRADISSMRNADDLSRITPLVFNELTTLGIPFIRCGVFIVHEKSKNVQVYLSTPEGKSLAAMNLPFDANELTTQSVAAWKKEDVFIQHWNQADFIHWGKSLQEQGHVKDIQTYQDAEAAPESLHLHFIPFTQGLLYVGSTETLAHEQIDLAKALAKSFAIAYARYEDFVKLEAAKAAVESAMDELKSTQAQLVQQEKLASLGQLTAGIAHEIKNPLNFVNNFSEVSLELIDESLEEMNRMPETRDETIVNENLGHIKSNIKKVLDHGTRANSIVNSMLMHSRQGSGHAAPTMLNDFIREYSNLAYHGMRAGNHPLDVQMNFNLDGRVKEVPLIAEDFSRVVLNICNNAFDAMGEKTKYEVRNTKYEVNAKFEVQNAKDEVGEDGLNYIPTLSIQTKLENGKVLIQFEDNGPGIPDEIKDKILQPFFTTKKGTEGTGLGLSITNDIIKAHGGEIRVETREREGSAFSILLPV